MSILIQSQTRVSHNIRGSVLPSEMDEASEQSALMSESPPVKKQDMSLLEFIKSWFQFGKNKTKKDE